MPYIIVRETDTGVLVEGLGYTEWSEIAALSQVILVIFATYLYHFDSFQVDTDISIRDDANSRFVVDTDVNSLINILEKSGKTKQNFSL